MLNFLLDMANVAREKLICFSLATVKLKNFYVSEMFCHDIIGKFLFYMMDFLLS